MKKILDIHNSKSFRTSWMTTSNFKPLKMSRDEFTWYPSCQQEGCIHNPRNLYEPCLQNINTTLEIIMIRFRVRFTGCMHLSVYYPNHHGGLGGLSHGSIGFWRGAAFLIGSPLTREIEIHHLQFLIVTLAYHCFRFKVISSTIYK